MFGKSTLFIPIIQKLLYFCSRIMRLLDKKYVFVTAVLLLLVGCVEKERAKMTPWGSAVDEEEKTGDGQYSLDDIMNAGEMIVLTVSGPDTYYDYHGHGLGVQYMMCENFAREIGVTLRVEQCKDTVEMIRKLKEGYGDVIAVLLPKDAAEGSGLRFCGAVDKERNCQWAVPEYNKTLADALDKWYRADMPEKTREREDYLLSAASVKRRVYAPVLDRKHGIMSNYDGYFRRYAPMAGLDWHLLAAQCYQESCFDPQARSWAGACGLMQLMPATAARYGLSREEIFHPEKNVATGARIMGGLMQSFGDIPNHYERINFALAAYNAGPGHVRDAMALARKYGENQYSWDVVSQYVLRLSTPEYYKDPVVKYGYMRGSETAGYVSSIRKRYGY